MDAKTRFLFLIPLLIISVQQAIISNVSAIEERNGDVLRLHSMDKGTTTTTHVDDHQNNNNININNINGEERINEVEDKNPKVPSDQQANHEINNHRSLNPKEFMFFRVEELHIGKTLTLFFREGSSSLKEFLPKEVADKIPFSSKELPRILKIFSIPEGSSKAQKVETTLKACEKKPAEGEIKSCFTSLPSMLDFAKSTLGMGSNNIEYVSTQYVTGLSSTGVHKYTVTELPEKLPGNKLVVCHILNYPYRVRACHSMEKTYGYRIHLLSQENGDEIIEAIGICHFDTSDFRPDFIGFRVLGTKPGDGNTLCHLAQPDNIIFFPST